MEYGGMHAIFDVIQTQYSAWVCLYRSVRGRSHAKAPSPTRGRLSIGRFFTEGMQAQTRGNARVGHVRKIAQHVRLHHVQQLAHVAIRLLHLPHHLPPPDGPSEHHD